MVLSILNFKKLVNEEFQPGKNCQKFIIFNILWDPRGPRKFDLQSISYHYNDIVIYSCALTCPLIPLLSHDGKNRNFFLIFNILWDPRDPGLWPKFDPSNQSHITYMGHHIVEYEIDWRDEILTWDPGH